MLLQPKKYNDTVYAVYPGGGLFRTHNFFAARPTWVQLTDQLVSNCAGSAAIGRNDKVYLGLGDVYTYSGCIGGIVYTSDNGGNNWNPPIFLSHASQTASVIYDVKIDHSGSVEVVLVCTNLGIFRSTDGGKTFKNVYYIPAYYRPSAYQNRRATIRVFSITLTSLGWIGVDRALSKFLLSTDHGQTWSTPADAQFY